MTSSSSSSLRHISLLLGTGLSVAVACGGTAEDQGSDTKDAGTACQDLDGDGAGVGSGCSVYDCDDTDPTVPVSVEVCDNSKDDDCNGAVDDGCVCPNPNAQVPCGGLGACAGIQTCNPGTGWGPCAGARLPAASETCGNLIDENCDGQRDEGCPDAGPDAAPD